MPAWMFKDEEMYGNAVVSGGGGAGSGGMKQTLLWDYQEDGTGVLDYNPTTLTLREPIENFDLLYVQVASSSGDFNGTEWRGMNQWFLFVSDIENGYEPNRINYTSYGNRASNYYIKGTTFQKRKNNEGGTNATVRIIGIKF